MPLYCDVIKARFHIDEQRLMDLGQDSPLEVRGGEGPSGDQTRIEVVDPACCGVECMVASDGDATIVCDEFTTDLAEELMGLLAPYLLSGSILVVADEDGEFTSYSVSDGELVRSYGVEPRFLGRRERLSERNIKIRHFAEVFDMVLDFDEDKLEDLESSGCMKVTFTDDCPIDGYELEFPHGGFSLVFRFDLDDHETEIERRAGGRSWSGDREEIVGAFFLVLSPYLNPGSYVIYLLDDSRFGGLTVGDDGLPYYGEVDF